MQAVKLPVMVALCTSLVSGCSSNNSTDSLPFNTDVSTIGAIISNEYSTDDGDGLIAGLGLSGLKTSPEFYADASAPTTAELRRAAIYNNYIALVDKSSNGGFGTLYGPIDDTLYPGKEFIAFVGEGINRAALMVQIPDSFDLDNPCIVAAPSSGSRGIYGAIGTGGEWGLRQGCAVAYTDANKGTGAIDLTQNTGFGLQLQALDLSTSTEEASFVVPTQETANADLDAYASVTLPTQDELDSYIANNPDRFAFKHAHSQKNIEKDWGLHTLQSVKFAFQQLNSVFDTDFNKDNTLVIGASVSNGGAAIIKAVEQDNEGLFDAIVAGEPNVNPAQAATDFSIIMGDGEPFTEHSKSAYEYFVLSELYAGCASKAPSNTDALFAELRGPTDARCQALVAAGLLSEGTLEENGIEAMNKLNDGGYLPESNKLLVGYSGIDLFQSLLATYGNAYTRSSVVDALCNVSMAHVTTGEVTPSASSSLATLAANSSGIPRTADVFLIKDDAPNTPTLQLAAASSSGETDYNLEGALCWQSLLEDTSHPLHTRLMQGIDEIRANGNLRGIPSIIVHGRSDALIPVNHSSRPYFALNAQVEGENSHLHYYEVKHAQHLDSLNQSYFSANMQYVPIDYYFKQSLDLMYDHLVNGSVLPPSQVVSALPPQAALQQTDLPDIKADASDLIQYIDHSVLIPE